MRKIIVAFVTILSAISLLSVNVMALGGNIDDIEQSIIADGGSTEAVTDIVTDEDGMPVTEVPAGVDGEEETSVETTVPVGAVEGQFTLTREFDDEDTDRLMSIRDELNQEKENKYSGASNTVCAFAGIIIIIYTSLILLAFLFDKFNIFEDFEAVRALTLNHACTLIDQGDLEQIKSISPKIFILDYKGLATSTITGYLLGVLLLNSGKILSLLYTVYDLVSGGGLS